jgi:hypothetical protein
MRTLIIGAALATLIASPAFAQAYDPNYGSGNLVFPPGAPNRAAPVVPPRATDNVTPVTADGYAYEPEGGTARAQEERHVRATHKPVHHMRRNHTQN